MYLFVILTVWRLSRNLLRLDSSHVPAFSNWITATLCFIFSAAVYNCSRHVWLIDLCVIDWLNLLMWLELLNAGYMIHCYLLLHASAWLLSAGCWLVSAGTFIESLTHSSVFYMRYFYWNCCMFQLLKHTCSEAGFIMLVDTERDQLFCQVYFLYSFCTLIVYILILCVILCGS